MNEPKYMTTYLADIALNKEIKRLTPGLSVVYTFGYDRAWDKKGRWIADFLTAFKSEKEYKTTLSPEKFDNMSDQGKKDFILSLVDQLDHPQGGKNHE